MAAELSATWHVIPERGLLDHERSESCWCLPTVREDGVVLHVEHDDSLRPLSLDLAQEDDEPEED